jgi:hypothetical protein
MKKLTVVTIVDVQLNGWDVYDALGLDQKAELCIEVAGRLADGECDIRMKVFDTAVECLDEAGGSKRWVHGSRDNQWHLVGPEDRDYATGRKFVPYFEISRNQGR